MKDENVYRKLDNGRYQAFGVYYHPNYLTDGIYYVRHKEAGRSISSVPYIAGLFRVGYSKEIDIPTLCGMEDLCDKITESKEFRELVDKGSYSIQDIIHVCVKVLYDEAKKEKE